MSTLIYYLNIAYQHSYLPLIIQFIVEMIIAAQGLGLGLGLRLSYVYPPRLVKYSISTFLHTSVQLIYSCDVNSSLWF